MLVELVYMLNAGLEDGTIGVNAQLDSFTVISGHAVPPDVNVYNQIEHSWVARRQLNTDDSGVTLPAIAVFQPEPARHEGEVQTIYRKGDYPIVFGYVVKKNDSALGARQGGYTMKALRRFLRDFMENSNAANRTANGVIISQIIGDITEPPVLDEWGKVEVVAAHQCTFRLRDTSP